MRPAESHAEKLIALTDHAYLFRRMELVKEASRLFREDMPSTYKVLGDWYEAMCLKRSGQVDKAWTLFEQMIGRAHVRFRARGLSALGAICEERREYSSALKYRKRALRITNPDTNRDPLITIQAQRAIAVYRGLEGDHLGAIETLRNLLKTCKLLAPNYPALYFDCQNSLAVELCEVGKLEEARQASQIALSSPYAQAYPEWKETDEDISRKELEESGGRNGNLIAFNIKGCKKTPSLSETNSERAKLLIPKSRLPFIDKDTKQNRLIRLIFFDHASLTELYSVLDRIKPDCMLKKAIFTILDDSMTAKELDEILIALNVVKPG